MFNETSHSFFVWGRHERLLPCRVVTAKWVVLCTQITCIQPLFCCSLTLLACSFFSENVVFSLSLLPFFYSKEKSFLILSDSLSLLQSILNLKYAHPVLVQILELYTEVTREGREIVFIWVPGHVGIRGNSAADSAAKDALDGDISVELIPFSDLKPRTNKYILELWQSEWDEFPENKLYKIFPVLTECMSCPRKNRKETDGLIAHWPFFSYSFLFIEGWCASDVINV